MSLREKNLKKPKGYWMCLNLLKGVLTVLVEIWGISSNTLKKNPQMRQLLTN